jgi:hypothetical protein
MSATRIIRYTTHPEYADENARLIGNVFAALAHAKPDGVHYAAFRLEDEVSFMHVVTLDGDVNPLNDVPAFQEFQANIMNRVVAPPVTVVTTVVGNYELLTGW